MENVSTESQKQSSSSMSSSKLQSFSDLFRSSWELVTKHMKILAGALFAHVGVILIPYLAVLLIFGVGAVTFAGFAQSQGSSLSLGASAAAIIGGLVLLLVFYVVIMVLAEWMSSTLVQLIAGLDAGKQFTVGAAMKQGWKRVWSLLGLAILMGLIIGFSSILLVIPGIILAVYLGFADFVLLVENRSVTESLSRSWRLVRGYFWPVLGRIVLLMLVFGATILVGMILVFIPFLGALVLIAYEFFAVVFIIAFMYYTYKDLVRLHGKEVG